MFYHSPAGWINIEISGGFITEIIFTQKEEAPATDPSFNLSGGEKNIFEKCITQLEEYFSGERKNFQLPIRQEGTAFQEKVWNHLMQIPYGKTISYLQFAQQLGNVKAIRAAASANGRNHLSIVVPCHRVIGSNGSLTGYGGGLPRKKWLLELENRYAHGSALLF